MPNGTRQANAPVKTGTFEAAHPDPNVCFDRRARVIVLLGPGGKRILARYASEKPVDPETQVYYTIYKDPITPYDSVRPPKAAPTVLDPVCVPFPRGREKALSVTAGGARSVGSPSVNPTERDVVFSHGKGAHAKGLAIKTEALEVSYGAGGLRADTDGVEIQGQLRQTQPGTRGLSAESPAWGVLPKTAVTFWAADVRPDIENLLRVAATIRAVWRVLVVINDLVNIFFDTDEFLDDVVDEFAPDTPTA